VTERKRAEEMALASAERYRGLFESNPNPMWVYDLETLSFLAVNSTAVELYGYSRNEFLAMNIKDIRPGEDVPALIDNLEETTTALGAPSYWRHRKKDGTVIDVEIRSHQLSWLGRRARVVLVNDVTKDKRELIAEVWSTLVRNGDGTPRSVLSINNDITEQKKLEAQLLRAQRLESIGTLASGVAHDLNNVLTPILMCSQALRSELGEEDRQSALALIEESAQRGAGIVKQVLTFARGIEGEGVLSRRSHLMRGSVEIGGE